MKVKTKSTKKYIAWISTNDHPDSKTSVASGDDINDLKAKAASAINAAKASGREQWKDGGWIIITTYGSQKLVERQQAKSLPGVHIKLDSKLAGNHDIINRALREGYEAARSGKPVGHSSRYDTLWSDYAPSRAGASNHIAYYYGVGADAFRAGKPMPVVKSVSKSKTKSAPAGFYQGESAFMHTKQEAVSFANQAKQKLQSLGLKTSGPSEVRYGQDSQIVLNWDGVMPGKNRQDTYKTVSKIGAEFMAGDTAGEQNGIAWYVTSQKSLSGVKTKDISIWLQLFNAALASYGGYSLGRQAAVAIIRNVFGMDPDTMEDLDPKKAAKEVSAVQTRAKSLSGVKTKNWSKIGTSSFTSGQGGRPRTFTAKKETFIDDTSGRFLVKLSVQGGPVFEGQGGDEDTAFFAAESQFDKWIGQQKSLRRKKAFTGCTYCGKAADPVASEVSGETICSRCLELGATDDMASKADDVSRETVMPQKRMKSLDFSYEVKAGDKVKLDIDHEVKGEIKSIDKMGQALVKLESGKLQSFPTFSLLPLNGTIDTRLSYIERRVKTLWKDVK